jgi:uncharacterized protein
MSDPSAILDWTQGRAGICYQQCPACSLKWYARRNFCPACGNASPVTAQASGKGVVYATTVVSRAPAEAFRAYAPYTIVLVDCVEGIRIMAHGDAGLKIGDRVVACYAEFGGRQVPHFQIEAG